MRNFAGVAGNGVVERNAGEAGTHVAAGISGAKYHGHRRVAEQPDLCRAQLQGWGVWSGVGDFWAALQLVLHLLLLLQSRLLLGRCGLILLGSLQLVIR